MADQTRTPPQKEQPEGLALRATPERVVRFKRNVLIGTAALAIGGVSFVVGMGLKSPSFRSEVQGKEVFNVDHKVVAEEVNALASNYTQVKPTKLGEPLPGELGKAVLEQERSYGIASTDSGNAFHQNEEANQARAERLRLAQQARQAKEANVFFPLSQNRGAAQVAAASGQGGAASAYPGETGGGGLNLDPDRDQNSQQRKIDFI
ncbi:MAG: TrbI/VirB10 family protein, partial [Rhodospirillaceae bacterium]